MDRIVTTIEEAFADPAHVRSVIENDVPLLAADWGAKDEGALIHSLGLHLLASLGRAVGYVGLPEFPVPRARQWQKKAVRVDCAWIDRQARRPVLLADPVPEVLVLCIWALDGCPSTFPGSTRNGRLRCPVARPRFAPNNRISG